MDSIIQFIDSTNEKIGKAFSWLMLVMAGVTFITVIFRYLFGVGWVWMQEISVYSHAVIFLGVAGFALLKDGHVRVDIFYRGASARRKAWVNLLGTSLLLFPTCILIFSGSLPYVIDSWSVFEGSKDGGGLEAVFILKSFILVFSVLLFLQGFSEILKSLKVLNERHS